MSDETIKPALTAEEWAQVAECPWPDYRYDIVFGLPDKHRASYRHVHAAVALYGQPFGFTQEELEAVRDAEVVERGDRYDPGEMVPSKMRLLESVAAKIAALLPPPS